MAPGNCCRTRWSRSCAAWPALAARASLQAALQAVGAAPRVSPLPDGRIRLEVAATPAVLDELERQRLEPLVVAGQVTLLLVPTAP